MGNIWETLTAIFSRIIFIGHAMYSLQSMINRLAFTNTDHATQLYWLLSIILGFFIIEGAYTIIIRKGSEYKFFWPSGFIYLTIMIPITWILELFLFNEEMKCLEANQAIPSKNATNNLALVKFCNLATAASNKDQKVRSAIEIGMLGALVAGRWLLPRGDLSRDQLSNLLLNYISNGADVIEFLNTSNDFPVLRTPSVVYTVLVVYSWSLLQFAVVTTKKSSEYTEDDVDVAQQSNAKTRKRSDPALPAYLQKLTLKDKSNKNRKISAPLHNLPKPKQSGLPLQTNHKNNNNDDSVNHPYNKPRSVTLRSRTESFADSIEGVDEISTDRVRLRGFTLQSTSETDLPGTGKVNKKFDQEVFQVLISLFTLETPYFIARVVFTLVYSVSSITMIFYTMKNCIMVTFLIYRLWVILSGKTEDHELNKTSTESNESIIS